MVVFCCSSIAVVLFDTPGISLYVSQHVGSVEASTLLHSSLYLCLYTRHTRYEGIFSFLFSVTMFVFVCMCAFYFYFYFFFYFLFFFFFFFFCFVFSSMISQFLREPESLNFVFTYIRLKYLV